MAEFVARLDTRQQEAWLRRYTDANVEKVLTDAAQAGAKAAARVVKAEAPIGTALRLSQYYRRMGLRHGAFRNSVKAAKIRGRGSAIRTLQARTVGDVIGPIGKNAFTRFWREYGFRHVGGEDVMGLHWLERVAPAAFEVAEQASDAILGAYADG